jgi:hypothetical protein
MFCQAVGSVCRDNRGFPSKIAFAKLRKSREFLNRSGEQPLSGAVLNGRHIVDAAANGIGPIA